MNFFGHAYLVREAADPRFVLGAMLPDFCSMTGARPAAIAEGVLAAGVAHHHAVDDVFHRSAAFVAAQERSTTRLKADGVRWGTARAVAHVGVELLIDGELTRRELASAAYLDALAVGTASATFAGVTWKDPSRGARVPELLRRLSAHGVPYDYQEADVVLARLEGALRHRPRLCIETDQREAVRREIGRLAEEVPGELAELVPSPDEIPDVPR